MATLAIRGHENRGEEVIEILEMLGGKTSGKLAGDVTLSKYYTNSNGYITYEHCNNFNNIFIQYTLEEFLEKFPYKVGDKVCFPDDLSTPFTIKKMRWDENANELLCSFIEDDIEVPVVGIRTYKEKSIDKTNKVIFEANAQSCDIMNDIIKEEDTGNGIIYDEIDFNRCPAADKVHLILGNNYEIKEENGNYYVVRKKPKYPKTYEECCKVLNLNNNLSLTYNDFTLETPYDDNLLDLLGIFRQLKICRDAYWKIAGEEIGLGKPWEPDWNNILDKYCIYIVGREIWLKECQTRQCNLAFPTEEMRDAFYENFKELINKIKELL